jgi:hypothetical protein
MNNNNSNKKRGGCCDGSLDKILPGLLIGLFGCLVGLTLGLWHEGVIPKQYYVYPWTEEAVTNVMGLSVNNQATFWSVWLVMFFLSFVSALTARAMTIWEWEMINFSERKTTTNPDKNRLSLFVVSLFGTFFLSITSIVNLFFSVTSAWYLAAAAFGRVAATLLLNYVKNKENLNSKR